MSYRSMKKPFFLFLTAGLLTLPGQASQMPENELEQMVISASRTEQQVQDAASQVYVITAADIQARQIKDIQDLLREIPGVRITEKTGTWGNGGNVQLMGMNAEQSLILVDGQRFKGGHGSVDISSFPVESIERIEIVKGPGSALYGADAMAGVVHIITRKAEEGKHLRVGASAGSRDRITATAGTDLGNERMGLRMDYTHKATSGVNEDTDKMDSDALSAGLHYRPMDTTTLSLMPFFSRQNNRVKGEADRTQERIGLNTSAEIRPDALSRIQARASYFSHDHEFRSPSAPNDTTSTLQEFETGYSRVLGRHGLSAGYAYSGESADDKYKKYTKDSQNTHGVYLQDEIDLGRLALTLGGRLDKHNEWGSETHPRAGLLFRATDTLRFRASAGTSFMAPTLLKLYADGWKMGPWTMNANPDLKPEKTTSYQTGMDFEPASSLLIRAALFRNEIDDLIETTRSGRTMSYRNVSEALTQGLETTLTWKPLRAFSATLGYTWTDTENKQNGRSLLDRPEHVANLDLDYLFTWPDLRFRLSTIWTGEREFEENSVRKTRSDYTQMDLTVTCGMGKNMELFTRLENLTREEEVGDEPDIDGTQWLAGVNLKF